MTEDAIWQARVDLAAAYRLADRYGYTEGICNHLTMTVPGRDDRFLIIAYGMHWSEVTASNLIVVDAEGNTVEGDGATEPTAFHIHSRIHRARPDAKCVMHTHQAHATSLCMLEDFELPFALQTEIRFYGRVAYDRGYEGLALDDDEGDRIVAALADKDVLMMTHHGVTVVGPSVGDAWNDLYYLEEASRKVWLALSTGRALARISEATLEATADQIAAQRRQSNSGEHAGFAAWKRLLDREQPDYRT